jgi:hypothetical protein
MKIDPVGGELFYAEGRTERWKDRYHNAKSRFCNFANAPRKVQVSEEVREEAL